MSNLKSLIAYSPKVSSLVLKFVSIETKIDKVFLHGDRHGFHNFAVTIPNNYVIYIGLKLMVVLNFLNNTHLYFIVINFMTTLRLEFSIRNPLNLEIYLLRFICEIIF